MILRFITFLLLFSFFSCETLLKYEIQNPKSEIKEVYHKEVQYLKARISNDLNTLYFFQHPEYKAVISLDKFVSANGYLRLNYASVTEQNPLPQIDVPLRQFPAIVKDFRIEEYFMDKNGKYAKFHIVLMVDIFLPITKGVPLENKVKDIIYWEKFNGEWVILNKVRSAPFAHISGAATKNPINLPEVKAEYIEIPIKEVEKPVK